jgi:transglutaminase-like putative cysteine protease
MAVTVGALPAPLAAGETLPLYWRSLTYDVYTGQGWSSSQTDEILYQPGDLLRSDHTRDELVLEQHFFPVEALVGAVYAAGEPVWMDQPVQAAWRSPGDLFGIHMASATGYEMVSSVPVASELHLRLAGQRYPDWVRRRFLSLPANIPGRVKALAAQLTASQSTPYDRARAIEQYLRTYPYTLDVTRPPVTRDVVDFFLFDLKKGYCDYYASAMVVLARAAGVPARLAVGYASGTYNLNSNRYLVTEADAHTWVEVYFPGIGWVPFEPTAARPALERTPVALQQLPENPILPTQTPAAAATGLDFWQAMWFASAAVAVSLVAWSAFDEWRLHRLPQPASASEVYGRMQHMGRLLHATSTPGDTPFEFSASLRARVRLLTARQRSRAFGLRTVDDVDKIATGIVRANYGPSQSMDLGILSQWRRLRWRLRMIWLLQNWRSIRGRLSRSLRS